MCCVLWLARDLVSSVVHDADVPVVWAVIPLLRNQLPLLETMLLDVEAVSRGLLLLGTS